MNFFASRGAHPAQRVGVFVDVQNIYHSAKNLYHSRVNFEQLIRTLTANRPLVRAVAYVVKSEGVIVSPDQDIPLAARGEEQFFGALRNAGMELRLKDLQVFPGGLKKANWDVGMAVDAIRMANFLDVVILVTGDGDFVPLVDYLKWGMGRQVEVASFSRTTSGKLKEVADVFIELESIPRILLRIRKGQESRSRNQEL